MINGMANAHESELINGPKESVERNFSSISLSSKTLTPHVFGKYSW
jgi:hypothetical protein